METVDSTGQIGEYSSITIDSNDVIHISYYRNASYDLKYASGNFGTWSITTIDSLNDVGKYSSIAVDSNDDIHVSYYDSNNSKLRYATNKGGGNWISQSLSPHNWGEFTSIVVDSNNHIHISCYNSQTGDLAYFVNNGLSWENSTIDGSSTGVTVGRYSSIALDSNNNVHISYLDTSVFNPNAIKLAYFEPKLHDDNLEDYSDNEHHASVEGMAILGDGVGNLTSALRLNSDWNYGNYLIVDCYISNNCDIGIEDFTLSAWVKPIALSSSYQMIVNYGDLELKYTSSTWGANFGGSGGPVYMTSDGPEEDKWTLATLVRDSTGVTPMIYFYLDGVEVYSEVSTGANLTSTEPLYIGADESGSLGSGSMGDFLYGTIDELFLLDRAIDSSEVLNYFQKSGGPKIYLTLDETQGVLADQSGNDLNAYPYGCPTYGQDGLVDDSIRFGHQFPSCGSRFEVPQDCLLYTSPSPRD